MDDKKGTVVIFILAALVGVAFLVNVQPVSAQSATSTPTPDMYLPTSTPGPGGTNGCPNETPVPGQMIDMEWLQKCQSCITAQPNGTQVATSVINQPTVDWTVAAMSPMEKTSLAAALTAVAPGGTVTPTLSLTMVATPQSEWINYKVPVAYLTTYPDNCHNGWCSFDQYWIPYAGPNGGTLTGMAINFNGPGYMALEKDDHTFWYWAINETGSHNGYMLWGMRSWQGEPIWQQAKDWMSTEFMADFYDSAWQGNNTSGVYVNPATSYNVGGMYAIYSYYGAPPVLTPTVTPTSSLTCGGAIKYATDPAISFNPITIRNGVCVVVLPGLSNSLISWPSVQVCPKYVTIMPLSFFGLTLPVTDLLMLPLVGWLITSILRW